MKILKNKMIWSLMSVIFLYGMFLGCSFSVGADLVQTTIFEEGFEGDWTNISSSSNWQSNTGWLDSWYGSSHSGSGWAFSWSKGDNLTSKSITFGSDTELSFWYKPENTLTPMSLDVYLDGSTKIWSKSGFQNINYVKATVDLSNYTGDHTISFVGNKSSLDYGLLLDDIVIISYVEEGSSGDDDDDTTSPPVTPPPVDNTAPIADLSNGEPYQGFTNGTILFDGTNSSDPDEGDEIIKWLWDFGDNTSKPGETVYHNYEEPGTYTVTLRVIDSHGADDTDTTTVSIQKGNNPPGKPRLEQKGSLAGFDRIVILKNQSGSGTFVISSSDADGDSLSFDIDWGDQDYQQIDNVDTGESITVNHTWENAGRYKISVTANDDNGAASEEAHLIVFMNLGVEPISGEITGYLYADDDEGDYTHFFHPDLDIETDVEKDEYNQYLIDSNDDDEWEYVYNTTTGLMTYQSDAKNVENDDSSGSDTPGFEILLVLAVLFIIINVIRKKNWVR